MKPIAQTVCLLVLTVTVAMTPAALDAQATPTVPVQSGAATSSSNAEPAVFSECELDRCGTWKLKGTGGTAEWIGGPVRAMLRITELSGNSIVIRRIDTEAPLPGLTAVYRGTIKGRTIAGSVVWTQSGQSWPNNQRSGTWSAKLISGSIQNLAAGPPFY